MTETLAVTHALAGGPTPAASPFDELVERWRPQCETAVDATDIAVMLEVGGINDAIAARTYCARDAHDLAERLLRAVPTRTAHDVTPRPNRVDRSTAARLIQRGALYAAPGAFYLAIAPDIQSAWAGLAVIGTTAAGWATSQLIGIFAHRLTVRTGPGNTHRVLRRVLVLAIPLAIAAGWLGHPAIGSTASVVLAAQILFAAAAAILLFYDADRALGYGVLPGAAVAVACTLHAPGSASAIIVAIAAGGTAIAAACAAWVDRSGEPRADAGGRPQYPTAGEWLCALAYVLYGLLCAAVLAFRPVLALSGRHPGPALAVLPIVVVMGYGELAIRTLRTDCQRVARRSGSWRSYRRRARRQLARFQARVIVTLLLSTAAVGGATWLATGMVGEILDGAATIALGCAVITGLVGCALGHPLATSVSLGLALAVIAALAFGPLDPSSPAGYLIACVLLLAGTSVAAVHVIHQPTSIIS